MIIPILNFVSRLILAGTSLYKTLKVKDKGWGLITLGFTLSALDIEEYILEPLGIKVAPELSPISQSVSMFYVGFFFLAGGLLIKLKDITLKHEAILSTIVLLSYIWIFMIATKIITGDSALIFPSIVFSLSTIYLGLIFLNYIVNPKSLEILLPLGLIGLGALNLTYPFTRNIEWFASFAFLTASILRVLSAIGIVKLVFFASPSPSRRESPTQLKPGACWSDNPKKVLEMLSPMNIIAITRSIPENTPNSWFIYWLTKVEEGEVRENIYAISPTKLEILPDLVKKALKLGYDGVYIDGIEALVIENGFKSVAKFLLHIKDIVLAENKFIILTLDPRALKEEEIKIIEKEFKKLELS
ncbi:DUF835 domain-containing protein [Pyrococcus woesei]|uniref:DUF835 domain-containing protein n=1 Tax=Pyrococcus woesei TaxID=2262 RepID=UPI003D2F2E2A